jgi:hypothetical protein
MSRKEVAILGLVILVALAVGTAFLLCHKSKSARDLRNSGGRIEPISRTVPLERRLEDCEFCYLIKVLRVDVADESPVASGDIGRGKAHQVRYEIVEAFRARPDAPTPSINVPMNEPVRWKPGELWLAISFTQPAFYSNESLPWAVRQGWSFFKFEQGIITMCYGVDTIELGKFRELLTKLPFVPPNQRVEPRQEPPR